MSGNSKQYLGKEYTEQQINEMDSNNIIILLHSYESSSSRLWQGSRHKIGSNSLRIHKKLEINQYGSNFDRLFFEILQIQNCS